MKSFVLLAAVLVSFTVAGIFLIFLYSFYICYNLIESQNEINVVFSVDVTSFSCSNLNVEIAHHPNALRFIRIYSLTSWVAWPCQATQLEPQKNNPVFFHDLNAVTPFQNSNFTIPPPLPHPSC